MIREHLMIRGRVQGVMFRGALQREAQDRGIRGWCRNCPDGSVEAILEGDEGAVQRVVAWSHQGPPAAKVTCVEIDEEPYKGEFDSFQIRY